MTEKQLHEPDEIDLFEIAIAAWLGKWIILTSIALSAAAGIAYSSFSTKLFSVKSDILVHYSVADEPLVINRLQALVGNEWNVSNSNKYFWSISSKNETAEPWSIAEYKDFFAEIENDISEAVKEQAESSLLVVESVQDAFPESETVMRKRIAAIELLYTLDELDAKVLTFSQPEINLVSPRTNMIFALSILLGTMIGCMIVLVQNSIRSRGDNAL